MHHPILKTLFARLRAFEALERASFAFASLDAMMEPFERHRVRVRVDDDFRVLSKGHVVGALLSGLPLAAGLTRMMRTSDRIFFRQLLESCVAQDMAFHFGATAATPQRVPVMLEGLLLPELPSRAGDAVSHASLCLVDCDFPSERIDRTAVGPLTLGPTRFLSLDNRGSDRVLLYKMRWPAPDVWQRLR